MKIKRTIKELSAVFVLLLMILIPRLSFAGPPLINQATSTCICSAETLSDECSKYCGNYTLNDILDVAVRATTILLGLSGSVALLFFVYGGVMFLISGGSPDKVTKGKQIIINSVIGIIVIFTSFIIIQFSMQALGYDSDRFGEWNVSN